ncbi:TonB-dependent receptor [candidate division WOR-3 bacterium]|nr:TonB-dependent receptor [candidate division WOR-3 bacterium]
MKTCFAVAAVAICLVGVAAAQTGAGERAGTIAGSVFDAGQGAPVEYANVVLYSLPESTQVNGTITDKTGGFRLDAVKPGRYYLEVSFIGYRDRAVKEVEIAGGAQVDLGRIELEQAPVPVQGVEATADKPAVSYEVDKKVVDVSRLPNAASGTAVDALRDVPSVKVDIEDNVTLRGSANFKVLIDGKPTLLDPNEVLKQTPAQTIDKIEIITNPSAKYEPDGAAGILNILLKKQKGRGTSALLNANGGMKNRYGADALVSVRQGIANIYAGGNVRNYTYDHTSQDTSRVVLGETDTLLRASVGTGTSNWLTGAGRAGLGLTFSPRDKSSISGRVGSFGGRSDGSSDRVELNLPIGSPRYYRSGSDWEYSRLFYFVTADHEHLLDTAGHKLTAGAYAVINSGGNNSFSTEMDSAGNDTTSGRHTRELGPMNRANLELGYTLPVRQQDKFEAGFQSRLEGTDQDLQISLYDTAGSSWWPDSLSSHRYGGTRNIQSLYATYTWSWRELGVQPGLRGEYGNRVVTVADSANPWARSAWDYFPSLHATYGLGSGKQITASYARRIDRPDPWYLRPVEVWYDEHWVSIGNPELRPSYTNSWEVGCEVPFGANFVSAEAYYRTTSDIVEWITKRYVPDSTVLLQTAANVGSDRSIGVEVTANVSPFKWFTAYLTGDVYHYREEATAIGLDTPRTTITWSSSANLTFRPATNTQVQLNGYYSGPSIGATTTSDGWLGANLAVKQSLLNRALSLTLRLSNILGSRTQHWRTEGEGFRTITSYKTEGPTVSLAVSYNFNNFKFDPKMRAGEGIEQEGAGGAGGGAGPQR